MSKKDRVLLMVLTTMMMNTNALSLPASAQSSEVAGGSGGSSISHNALVSSQQDNEQQDTAEALPEEATLEEEARTNVDAPSFNSDIKQICDHKWSSWKTTKSATVSSTGTRQHTCSACNAVETQTTAKLSLRLCGNDRYDTSIAIAKQLKAENGGNKFSSIIVTCGTKYPDALSASYLAKVKNAPILICGSDANSQTKMFDFIKNNTLSSAKVYIIGGTSAVDNNFEKKLKTYFKGSSQITRLWGEDRFKTNIQILKEASKYDKDTSGVVLVAHGMDYADALSASAVGKPILLVNGDNLTAEQQAYLKSAKLKTANIISTGNAVTSKIGTSISKFVSKVNRISGKDKYETSYLVANKFFSKPATVLMTYGENFPDGLCGGPLAIKYNAPMLLVSKENTKFAAKYSAAPAGKSDNAVSNSVTLGGETIMPNEMIKAVVTDKMIQSTVTSKTTAAVDITSQPTNKKVAPGASASFTVKASGKNVKYQWQSSLNGVSWINVNGKTSAAMSVKADLSMDGMKYRCMVTSACGYSVVSNSATLSVTSLAALKQPQAWTGAPDSLACFSCTPNRDGADVLWQYSKDNGKSWIDTAVKTQNYSVKITSANNGWLYRCRLSDSSTGEVAFSTSAKLTLSKTFKIFRQPASAGGALDTVLYFTVQAGGEGLKYQWQVSTDGKTGWKNVTNNSSATTVRFTQRVVPSSCGKYYRCIVTNKSGKTLTSTAARLIPAHTGFVTYGTKTYYILSSKTPATGWITVNNNKYYFASTGEMLTGVQTISGSKYYFDPTTGVMKTGLQKDGNNTYFFNTDGKAVSGWKTVNSSKYYFAPQSFAAVTGFRTIDSKTYYFNSSGVKTTGVILDKSSGKYRYIADTAVKNAFVTVNGAKYYIDKNGYALTGLQKIGSDTYYFGKSGVMLTGGYLVNKKRYFFDIDTGKAITGIKERENGKKYYYNGGNGVGTGLKKVGGKLYRFNSEGEMCFGRWHDTDNDKWYYFDPATGEAISGWMIHISDNGKAYKYYYSSSDHAAVTGVRKIGDDYYHFSDSGRIVGGTFEFEGTRRYFDIATGIMQPDDTGTAGRAGDMLETDNDGNKYYYDHSGTMLKGLQVIDNKLYLFDETTGKNKTGLQEYKGILRCFDESTDSGVLTGWQTVNGELYCFDNNGIAARSKVVIENGKTYYFRKDGTAATGFCYVPEYLCTYYFDTDHTAHVGWLNKDGKKYYFHKKVVLYPQGTPAHGITTINGKMLYFDYETGEQKTGLIKIGLNKYMYFDPQTGYAVSGLKTINGSLYMFSNDKESFGVSISGKVKIGNDTYCFDEITQKALKGFVTTDQYTNYFGSNYKMVTGVQKISGNTYYFNTKTGTMKTGLSKIGNKYYYFDDSGKAISGWYTNDDGDKYYFSQTDHAAYTGIQIIGNKKCFFSTSGKMRTRLITDENGKFHYLVTEGKSTGFIEAKGHTFYVNADGSVRTGLQTINGATYYFGSLGIMSTGACTINSKRYYFDPGTGKAVTGFVERENGHTFYYNGANGVKTGLQKIGKKTYLLSDIGIVQYGRRLIGNKYYYFDLKTGEAVSGWRESISSSGDVNRSYYSPSTLTAVKGLQKIDGAYYYFNDYGFATTATQNVNGTLMYFDPNTFKLYTGAVTINGKTYYSNGLKGRTLDKNAKAPAKANTWGTLNGSKCYYGQNGRLLTGLQIIEKKYYLFDENGKLLTGLIKYKGTTRYYTAIGAVTGLKKVNSSYYYFSPTDGSMLTGLKNVSDKMYFFDDTGRSREGWININGSKAYITYAKGLYTGLQTIGGKKYWFGTNGIMGTGTITVTEKGASKICLFGNDGAMVTGLVKRFGNLYYYDTATGARVSGWKKIGSNQYYFDETSGAAATGKRTINNYNYYFDTETAVRKTGVIKFGKYYYHFNSSTKDGLSYGLNTINGEKYFFDETTGASWYGFTIVDDVYYYFSEETGRSVGGIQWVSSDTAYLFVKGGGVKKGLVTYEGNQYYLYPSNGKVTTGLISVGDKLYYFDKKGVMQKNQTVTISGISYSIDNNGYVSVNGNSKLAKMIHSGIDKLGIPFLDDKEKLDDDIDPSAGYHCSRFVTKVLSDVNTNVAYTAFRQEHILTHSGKYDYEYVTYDKIKPGDIVYLINLECAVTDSECTYFNHLHHVMIYLGEGKMMHAFNAELAERRGVVIADYKDSNYWFTHKIIRLKEISTG